MEGTDRIRRALIALALAAVLLGSSGASASDGWKRVTIERQQGRIAATLSYETNAVDQYRQMTLVVRRSGTLVVDWLFPAGYQNGGVKLTLRNVWGDSDPEAIVQILSGGQSPCCTRIGVAVVDGAGGRVVLQDVGGWRGEWHDGTFYFVSDDERFFCVFSDCASSSGGPIQIFVIDPAGRRFVDVTRSRPDLIAADAAERWWYDRQMIVHKDYSTVSRRGYAPLGLLAAWCGDQYLLGRKDDCRRYSSARLQRATSTATGAVKAQSTLSSGNSPPGATTEDERLHGTLRAVGQLGAPALLNVT